MAASLALFDLGLASEHQCLKLRNLRLLVGA
jgi:hypothetical protein